MKLLQFIEIIWERLNSFGKKLIITIQRVFELLKYGSKRGKMVNK